jgi:hypothetical protein
LVITIKLKLSFLLFLVSSFSFSSIEDYIFSDIGFTSNIHGELGIIEIPSSRILEEGNLKLHLVNSDPINSLFMTATPFNWMEVSLRYADVNLYKYSRYFSFSGNQSYKDKSFNMKLRLVQETERFPELSIGFRDFIGTGRFSSEYIVASKKIGDFDFSVGLGFGAMSSLDGIENPFIDLDDSFSRRGYIDRIGGNFGLGNWFRGKKASSFYGFEYLNKRSGIRFKLDYDESELFNSYSRMRKKSFFNYGLAIPVGDLVDINLFRIRGQDIGLSFSYKANYSRNIVKKEEKVADLVFNESDLKLLATDDQVFGGTINFYLQKYEIFLQQINYEDNSIHLVLSQTKYRNENLATKRTIQVIRNILKARNIEKVSLTYEVAGINKYTKNFRLNDFLAYLDNATSYASLKRSLNYENFSSNLADNQIFKGKIFFPSFNWGISPNLQNHIGGPEAFYLGSLGLLLHGGVLFSKQTFLDGSLSFNFYDNFDDFKFRTYSKYLPKVRSDIREYLKEGKRGISRLTLTHIFDPVYKKNGLFVYGLKFGIFETMYSGFGSEILYRDMGKPWYISANAYWVKQREFRQKFALRDYETFTGHLNFIWETPLEGFKVGISAGRYLAKDSGITLKLSKTFKSGFVVGAFATKTDISSEEFGEGSFDKGIFFSIPLDIVSKQYREGYGRFLWRNLTRDGGQMLGGGLQLDGIVESANYHNLIKDTYGFEAE